MWALSPNLRIKLEKKIKTKSVLGQKLKDFLLGEKKKTRRVREGEKREMKNQNFSIRSTEFRRSEFVGPRTKVYLLDEGYVWVPKT